MSHIMLKFRRILLLISNCRQRGFNLYKCKKLYIESIEYWDGIILMLLDPKVRGTTSSKKKSRVVKLFLRICNDSVMWERNVVKTKHHNIGVLESQTVHRRRRNVSMLYVFLPWIIIFIVGMRIEIISTEGVTALRSLSVWIRNKELGIRKFPSAYLVLSLIS